MAAWRAEQDADRVTMGPLTLRWTGTPPAWSYYDVDGERRPLIQPYGSAEKVEMEPTIDEMVARLLRHALHSLPNLEAVVAHLGSPVALGSPSTPTPFTGGCWLDS